MADRNNGSGKTPSQYDSRINQARSGRSNSHTGADYSRGTRGSSQKSNTTEKKSKAERRELMNSILDGLGIDPERLAFHKNKNTSVPTKKKAEVINYALIRQNAERQKKKNQPKNKWLTFAKWFGVALLASYFIYQVYFSFYAKVDTEMVMQITVEDTISGVEGVSIRNERIITTDQSGVIVSAVENGGKVSKGETVARVFSSNDEAQTYDRIAEIDELLSRFEDMSTAAEDNSVGIDTSQRLLNEHLLELSQNVFAGNFDYADDMGNEILYLMNRQQIATKLVEGFDGRVSDLTAERKSLSEIYDVPPAALKSPQSGYYISGVDGYENVLNTDVLNGLSPNRLKELLDSRDDKQTQWVVGKIADDYIWYIACDVKASEAEKLTVGNTYTLRLPYSEIESIDAQLNAINLDEENRRAVLVFECTYMVSELADVRSQPITIILNSYTGLEIKKSCLVDLPVTSDSDTATAQTAGENDKEEEHGEIKGVYILWGNEALQRDVEIIGEYGDNVICKLNKGGDWLKLYDKIITDPKGMYDGKIINGSGNIS